MTCLTYVRGMPAAVQVVLCAGDAAFYRNTGWHLGNDVPYGQWATLHDGYYAPDEHPTIKDHVRQVEAAIPAADKR
jgi:hypothetical protein